MTTATETMTDQEITDRYYRLSVAWSPGQCFTCGRNRTTYTALVLGPDEARVTGKPIAGRGHGVCKPCIKAGEARSFRPC